MQNSKTKKRINEYDVSENIPIANEPIAMYSTMRKIVKPSKKTVDIQKDPFSLEEYFDELEATMTDATSYDDETALANAISMKEFAELVKKDIDEIYQKQKHETTSNNLLKDN